MKITVLLLLTILATDPRSAYTSAFPKGADPSLQDITAGQPAGSSVENVLAARRRDLIQLAKLYSIDLDEPDWINEPLNICPAFSKHFFVKFHESRNPDAVFIAIVPRRAGRIRIVRQGIAPQGNSQFASVRSSTIKTFNAIWADERSGSALRMVIQGLDWMNLATCYGEIAGERPAISADRDPGDNGADPHRLDIQHDGVSVVVFQVLSKLSGTASLSVNFDKQGFITRVDRTESDKPLPIVDATRKP